MEAETGIVSSLCLSLTGLLLNSPGFLGPQGHGTATPLCAGDMADSTRFWHSASRYLGLSLDVTPSHWGPLRALLPLYPPPDPHDAPRGAVAAKVIPWHRRLLTFRGLTALLGRGLQRLALIPTVSSPDPGQPLCAVGLLNE